MIAKDFKCLSYKSLLWASQSLELANYSAPRLHLEESRCRQDSLHKPAMSLRTDTEPRASCVSVTVNPSWKPSSNHRGFGEGQSSVHRALAEDSRWVQHSQGAAPGICDLRLLLPPTHVCTHLHVDNKWEETSVSLLPSFRGEEAKAQRVIFLHECCWQRQSWAPLWKLRHSWCRFCHLSDLLRQTAVCGH